ncbi:hypothetical protein ACMFMG_008624 [Clarireedia jacksonii]
MSKIDHTQSFANSIPALFPPAVLSHMSRVLHHRPALLFSFNPTKSDSDEPLCMPTAPPRIYFNWDCDRLVVLRPPRLSYGSTNDAKYPASPFWGAFLRGFRSHCIDNKLRYLALNAYEVRRTELPCKGFERSGNIIFSIRCKEIMFFDLKLEGAMSDDGNRDPEDWKCFKGRVDLGSGRGSRGEGQ